MAGLAVLDPRIHPPHDTPVASREYFLGVEVGLRRAGKELLPRRPDPLLPLDALAIRRRAGILEDAIVAHERHERVDVVAIEGVVEAVHDVDDAAGLGHCSRPTKYPATRHPRFPSTGVITRPTT